MKIAISGANGYIASNLILNLKADEHEVIAISRNELYSVQALTEKLSGTDVVINLAGASILRRWTKTNKEEILKSRISSTQNIVRVINQLPEGERPRTFISASAIGIYAPELNHTEQSTLYSNEFVGEVVQNWENASEDLHPEVRRVIFRIGLILGKEAKTITNLLPVFKMGFGGKLGTGRQPFPFIHITDVVRAMQWSIENTNVQGIYNLVTPENIDNKTFTAILAKSLKRPSLFTVPAFCLKFILGKASSLLLQSPRVFPERLVNEGFLFIFPDIESTIAEIVQ